MELLEDNPWIKTPLPFSVEDAVVRALEPNADGYIECAKEQAQKTADMLGALIQRLHETHVISDETVLGLLPNFKKYNMPEGA